VLCRKELDSILNGNFASCGYEECQNMSFMKIHGVSSFWKDDDKLDTSGLMSDILSSCVRHGVSFSFFIIGDENGINIYVGTMASLLEGLKTSFEAMYPGIDTEFVFDNPLKSSPCECGGLFTGIPTNKISSEDKNLQIENICRGMLGRKFTYVILASGISNITVTLGHDRILEEMKSTYEMINQNVQGGAQGNISVQRQNFNNKDYFDNLEQLEKVIKIGTARGMWRVTGYFAADNQIDAQRLRNIIKASFSGEESMPEAFRTIDYNSIKVPISGTLMMADLIVNPDLHPLGRFHATAINKPINFFVYRFQTILNSDQLSILCQLPTKEFPGYYIDHYVEFDVCDRQKESFKDPVYIGDICIANRQSAKKVLEEKEKPIKNKYLIEKNDLSRHALIIGITGGGKTNTSKSILNTLWNQKDEEKKIPFLVIESAKREYWELRNLVGFEDLLVFTLGAEAEKTAIKYRINPFETNPKISLQTHIDYLLSTFKAAFPLHPPLPYLLERAVYEIYSDRGWDIVENKNHFGFTEYPTLTDLYNKIDVIATKLGYHQEVQSNVKAALQARVYSLMIGGKGAMLNTPKSVPINVLLSHPVIMELEDLGDDETKSFVIGILLVQLYEYRKSVMTKGSKELSHILMVEEAHRLLKKVSEGGDEGGNIRAKSVEFFCNLLAEIRTFGQGIIIADQIPTKLAPDTIKNTNLKIVHRTVAQEDRETIGRAMNMNPEQIEYLSSLQRGFAALYAEGDNRPKCVKLPLINSFYEMSRDEVITEVKEKVGNIASGYDTITVFHHVGCSYCEQRCNYYEATKNYLDDKISVNAVLQLWKTHEFEPTSLQKFLDTKLMQPLHIQEIFHKICVIGLILAKEPSLNDGERQDVIARYLKYIF
jgi:hypothetical protein